MKTHKTNQPIKNKKEIGVFRRVSLIITSAITLACLATTGKAANILVNPDFGAAPLFAAGSWTQHASEGWSMSAGLAQTSVALIYPGSVNSLWMQGLYGNGQAGAQTSYAAQDFSCIAGNTYSADAWYSAYVVSAVGFGGNGAGGSGTFQNDASGNEDGWVEVLFYNSGHVLLADYTSTIITPAFNANTEATETLATNANGTYLPWEDFPVTNQYDPSTVVANTDPSLNTAGITNTVGSGQYIVAPSGAATVEFRINLFQANQEGGAPFWDNATLNLVGGPSASVIGNISPDGTTLFNNSANKLTFTVTSQAAGGATLPTNPTSGVQVIVNGVNESGSLQFSGTPTALNVTLPADIYSNQVYNISIYATNSAGLVASSGVVFDTFPTNAFVVASEDYDFTNGQFIQNPIPTNGVATNSYWGTAGISGVDQYDPASISGGGSTLAPNYPNRTDGDVAFQVSGDVPLPLYAAQDNASIYGVALAYNNGGNWCNYTRDPYPQGNYFVYGRVAAGGGANCIEYLNILTGGQGTDTQTTNELGEFYVADGTSYNDFAWIPLTDTFGNQVTVNIPAGRQTLQLLSGGGDNFAEFVFVPASGILPPAINNFNPPVNINSPSVDQQNIFVSASNITFTVSSSTGSAIATNGIQTLLNGTNVAESFTGNNTNWTVSVPLPRNQILTMLVNAVNAAGLSNSVTESFDTFNNNNYQWECVDYDFSTNNPATGLWISAQFIDNPEPTADATSPNSGNTETNSYFFYPMGFTPSVDPAGLGAIAQQGIDINWPDPQTGANNAYRPFDSMGSAPSLDYVRLKFLVARTNLDDPTICPFDVGYYDLGNWMNYTRHYPTGTFNVWGRLAGGAGPFSGTTLSIITNGVGTSTQAAEVLGTFADPNAAGWNTWHWVPLLGTNGNPVAVSLGGKATLRLTSGNNVNAEFLMLVPAVAPGLSFQISASIVGGNIQISIPTQSGSNYTVWHTSSLAPATWTQVGASIAGNGSAQVVTEPLTGGNQGYFRVMAN